MYRTGCKSTLISIASEKFIQFLKQNDDYNVDILCTSPNTKVAPKRRLRWACGLFYFTPHTSLPAVELVLNSAVFVNIELIFVGGILNLWPLTYVKKTWLGYVLCKICNTQLFIIYAFQSKSVKSWITGRIDGKGNISLIQTILANNI